MENNEKIQSKEDHFVFFPVTWSLKEQSFRRGFRHGFHVGINDLATPEEVLEWDYYKAACCPPGTGMAGHELPGLVHKNMYQINSFISGFQQYMEGLDDENFKKFCERWSTFCDINSISFLNSFDSQELNDKIFYQEPDDSSQ